MMKSDCLKVRRTRFLRSKHDLFLTLTQCFLYLNLTRVSCQARHHRWRGIFNICKRETTGYFPSEYVKTFTSHVCGKTKNGFCATIEPDGNQARDHSSGLSFYICQHDTTGYFWGLCQQKQVFENKTWSFPNLHQVFSVKKKLKQ